MQAQKTLAFPRRSLSIVVAVVATLVAAALALTLIANVHQAAMLAPSSVVVLHQQAPDAVERNQALAAQRSAATNHDQAPDAKERNAALGQGKYVYVQGGRPQVVYDEVARVTQK